MTAPVSRTPNPELEAALDILHDNVEEMTRLMEHSGADDVYRKAEERYNDTRSQLVSLYTRQVSENEHLLRALTASNNDFPKLQAELSRLRDTEKQLREENEMLRIANADYRRRVSRAGAFPGDQK